MPTIKIDYTNHLEGENLIHFVRFMNDKPKNEFGCGYLSLGVHSDAIAKVDWQFTQNILFQQHEPNRYQCFFIAQSDEKEFPKLEQLGSGAFGVVYEVNQIVSVSNIEFKQAPQQFVLKVQAHCACSSMELASAEAPCSKHNRLSHSLHEYNVMRQAPHLNTQLFYYHEAIKHSYMIMQKLAGKELYSRLYEEDMDTQQYTVEERLRLSINIVKAVLNQVTKLGFSHNDLKAENLMVGDSPYLEVNICDYGQAIKFSVPTKKYGTPAYMSPELLNAYAQQEPYIPNEKIDVFAIGITLLELWGETLVEPEPTELYEHYLYLKNTIQNKLWLGIFFSTIPEAYRPSVLLRQAISTILSNMLEFSPQNRIDFTETIRQFESVYTKFCAAKHPVASLACVPVEPPQENFSEEEKESIAPTTRQKQGARKHERNPTDGPIAASSVFFKGKKTKNQTQSLPPQAAEVPNEHHEESLCIA